MGHSFKLASRLELTGLQACFTQDTGVQRRGGEGGREGGAGEEEGGGGEPGERQDDAC